MAHWPVPPSGDRLPASRMAALAAVAGIVLLSACSSDGSPGPVITHPVDTAAADGPQDESAQAAGQGGGPGAAATGPGAPAAPARPAAVVSLGDSYISGEGGRWAGNSPSADARGWGGTDRACPGDACAYPDPDTVYIGGSDADGCHRSDVAEIRSADLPGATPVNLACSGASTANLLRAASGGHGQNGEPTQDDQLAAVARDYDVRLVVVSVGGNDIGFAGIIADCFLSYVSLHGCHGAEQAAVDAQLPAMTAGVAAAIDDIRAVLAAAGQQPGSYRLVLQSYPSPVPRADENRYSAGGTGRTVTGGCPVGDSDLNWAHDRFVPELGEALKAVAAQKQAQFLDLRDAFQGREVCSSASELVHGAPSGARDEWVRSTLSLAQGSVQEIMHPNAFGQRALGRCLALLAGRSGPSYACHNSPGQDESAMVLTPS